MVLFPPGRDPIGACRGRQPPLSESAPQAEGDARPADAGAGALEGDFSAAVAVAVELVLIVDYAEPAVQRPGLRPLLQRAVERLNAALPTEHIGAIQRQGRRVPGSDARHAPEQGG